MTNRRPIVIAAAAAILLAAPAPAADDAGRLLDQLEQRLLTTPRVELDYSAVATGAVSADLRGTLQLDGRRAELTARGSYRGEPVDLSLRCDGQTLLLRSGARTAQLSAPPKLREALVVGLVRMGILHNLVRLADLHPPDRGDGGVGSWVEIRSPLVTDEERVRFGIAVDGRAVGEASLVLDDDRCVASRSQTVRFPSGEMRVEERYRTYRMR